MMCQLVAGGTNICGNAAANRGSEGALGGKKLVYHLGVRAHKMRHDIYYNNTALHHWPTIPHNTENNGTYFSSYIFSLAGFLDNGERLNAEQRTRVKEEFQSLLNRVDPKCIADFGGKSECYPVNNDMAYSASIQQQKKRQHTRRLEFRGLFLG